MRENARGGFLGYQGTAPGLPGGLQGRSAQLQEPCRTDETRIFGRGGLQR